MKKILEVIWDIIFVIVMTVAGFLYLAYEGIRKLFTSKSRQDL